MSEIASCKLLRFNPRRAARNARAAKVEINGEVLWMNQDEIRMNMREFGRHAELILALAHYSSGREYPVGDA